MKLHRRTLLVSAAESELNRAISDLALKHQISSVELLQILSARAQAELKFMLRAERHPKNPNKKADEE